MPISTLEPSRGGMGMQLKIASMRLIQTLATSMADHGLEDGEGQEMEHHQQMGEDGAGNGQDHVRSRSGQGDQQHVLARISEIAWD